MNANELAEKLENKDRLWNVDENLMIKTCAMLRQQQAEIEALKAKTLTDSEQDACFNRGYKEGARDILNRQVKTLTDEEKWKLWGECPHGLVYDRVMMFADLILKKAQEK